MRFVERFASSVNTHLLHLALCNSWKAHLSVFFSVLVLSMVLSPYALGMSFSSSVISAFIWFVTAEVISFSVFAVNKAFNRNYRFRVRTNKQ